MRPVAAPGVVPEDERISHELLRFVREAVASGAPLPGEIELAGRLRCSRQQVRNALAVLERQGIVRRRQGAATTVDPVALRMSVRLEEQYEHAELLHRMGYAARLEVIEAREEPLRPEIGTLLGAEPHSPSLRVRKRWLADERPAMIADDILVLRQGVSIDPEESLFSSVEKVWGEPVVWEVATPGAAALDEEFAALFDLPVGSPVMTLELIGLGANGRRLYASHEYHHPELVRYSLSRTVRPPWSPR